MAKKKLALVIGWGSVKCVATDFYSGKPVVLTEGNLAQAVRISSGIPIVFKPVEVDGRQLVDGGISNQLLSKRYAYYNLKHHAEMIMILPEFAVNLAINDVRKFPEIIRKGEVEALKHIDYLKQLLK